MTLHSDQVLSPLRYFSLSIIDQYEVVSGQCLEKVKTQKYILDNFYESSFMKPRRIGNNEIQKPKTYTTKICNSSSPYQRPTLNQLTKLKYSVPPRSIDRVFYILLLINLPIKVQSYPSTSALRRASKAGILFAVGYPAPPSLEQISSSPSTMTSKHPEQPGTEIPSTFARG